LKVDLPKNCPTSLVGVPVTGFQAITYGIFLFTDPKTGKGGVHFTINNRPFDDAKENYRQIKLGDTEEWTVISKNDIHIGPVSHPFHIHVNPFEVISIKDGAGNELVKFPYWKDTLALNEGEKVTFRTKYEDFTGRFVQHCHILDHEDQGMMEIIEIVDLSKKPSLLSVNSIQRTPKMVLSDAGGNIIVFNQEKFLGKTTVIFLFRGLKCLSCSKQISGFTDMYNQFKEQGIDVIGISSEGIKELRKGLKNFLVPFSMYCDTTGEVFRSLGCMHGHSHGTFIVNKNDYIKWENIARDPYDNIQDVLNKAIATKTEE